MVLRIDRLRDSITGGELPAVGVILRMPTDSITQQPYFIVGNVVNLRVGFNYSSSNRIRDMKNARPMFLQRVGFQIAGIDTLSYISNRLCFRAMQPSTARKIHKIDGCV